MKNLLTLLLAAFMFSAPAVAFADTYYYSNYAPYGYNVASNCTYTYSPYYATSYVCNTGTGTNTQPNNTYPYNNGSYYNYGNTTSPTVSYITPTSGAVGTSVGIYGSGFSNTGNAVHFGNGVIANLVSTDGTTLGFTVPSQISGYGSQPITTGTYNVSVSNSAGYLSNTVPFTVTSLGSGSGPAIVTVSGPSTLGVNTQGTWTLSVNNQSNSALTVTVSWGDNGYNNSNPQTIYAQGQQTLTFTHSYPTSGTYTPIFMIANGSGVQNSAPATVVVSGSGTYYGGSTSLSYISPTAGSHTTQIMLVGSGFSLTDNTVHFGIGGTQHVPSQNGTTIYYTVPYYLSSCDLVGAGCAAQAQQVFAGTSYPIYVTNNQGTTNTLTFQVQ